MFHKRDRPLSTSHATPTRPVSWAADRLGLASDGGMSMAGTQSLFDGVSTMPAAYRNGYRFIGRLGEGPATR